MNSENLIDTVFKQASFINSKKIDISIDTSGFCNARCECCPWPYMQRSDSVMSFFDFQKILSRFDRFEFGEFGFNSINEPFADKTIIDKINYFIDKKIKTDILFFSSNWLIPGDKSINEFVAVIKKANDAPHIRKISINATISGIDSKTYDVLQAGKNIENANTKYKKLDFSRAEENLINLILGLQSVIKEDDHFVLNIKAYGSLFSKHQFQTYWLEKLKNSGIDNYFANKKIRILLNHAFTTFARQKVNLVNLNTTGRCSMNWLSDRIVIGSGGTIGLCCHEGAHQYNFGNLIDLPISVLANEKIFLKQLAMNIGDEKLPKDHICHKCEFYVREF
jgi:hypothetical protein